MNLELLRQALLRAARSAPVSDRVPYAFEKRVMARLGTLPRLDPWTFCGSLLWRAVVPCCALMLAAGIASYVVARDAEDLGSQLDAVLLADLDSTHDTP